MKLTFFGKDVTVKTKDQVGVLKECSDLVDNGYVYRYSYFGRAYWFIRMVHNRNGNDIIVIWRTNEWYVRKNNDIVKKVPCSGTLISD